MLKIAKKRTLLLIGLLLTTGTGLFSLASKKNFSKADSVLSGVIVAHADTYTPADGDGGVVSGDGDGGGGDGGCSDGCY
jgi:hypothetical protein